MSQKVIHEGLNERLVVREDEGEVVVERQLYSSVPEGWFNDYEGERLVLSLKEAVSLVGLLSTWIEKSAK